MKFWEKAAPRTLSEDELNERAVQRIITVVMIGVVLIAADLIFTGFSSPGGFVKEDGRTYLVRPDEDQATVSFTLKVQTKGEHQALEKRYNVTIRPYSEDESARSAAGADSEAGPDGDALSAEDEKELLETEIRKVISGLNDNRAKRNIPLPDELSTGEKLRWSIEKHNHVLLLLLLTLTVAGALYYYRLEPLKKLRLSQRESILAHLPEFVNRLVLLLNAGLVLSSAFEKAVEESMKFEENRNDYFYCSMQRICTSMAETNSSLAGELHRFTMEAGVNEMMRISNIINDNLTKGVELTQKLERESDALWFSRKQNCEERGRLAETKLTLPLTLFLMVLIIITVSPALLKL